MVKMLDSTIKLAIWGTGNVCSQLLSSFQGLAPDFFIDNDKDKDGCLFINTRIVCPDSVESWVGLYIILALDNYLPVKLQVEGKGLKEGENFIWYRDWIFQKKDIDIVLGNERVFMETCRQVREGYFHKRLLFSDFLSFDKGVCDFVNRWNEKEGDIVLLSEAGWVGGDIAHKKLTIPVLKLPELYWRNLYFRKGKVIPDFSEEKAYVEKKGYLLEAAANLRIGCPDMAEGYEYLICRHGEALVRELLRCWEPREVILWNAFYAFHLIIRNVCREENVCVRYMEFGNIPGTVMVEDIGQMGESWPAREPAEFLKIPVSEVEYEQAKILLGQLKESGLNRNVQPHNDGVEKLGRLLRAGCPTILYAGQNDNASGMQPYTDNTRIFHSPVFATSDEGAAYLAELCERQGWNFIYKPHPMMYANTQKQLLPSSAIVVNDVNLNELIDMVDVVATILSTVSYIALIREKPVVMLGYTQLKGKGCTYEAFEREGIGEEIEKAICENYSDIQRRNFSCHIAQMKRYYSC